MDNKAIDRGLAKLKEIVDSVAPTEVSINSSKLWLILEAMKDPDCDCHLYVGGVCDICQGVDKDNPGKDVEPKEEPKYCTKCELKNPDCDLCEEEKSNKLKDRERLEIWKTAHEQYKFDLRMNEERIKFLEDKIEKLKKHNCEEWFEEARGCAICYPLLLKSPIKTKKELIECQDLHNAKILELQAKLDALPSVEEIIQIILSVHKAEMKDLKKFEKITIRQEAKAIHKRIKGVKNGGKNILKTQNLDFLKNWKHIKTNGTG